MAEEQIDEVGMLQVLSALFDRTKLAGYFGKSYWKSTGASRDLYEALGYPLEITFEMYLGRFVRQDVASRIVVAPVESSWRLNPMVDEDEKDDDSEPTEFEQAWIDLEKKLQLYSYLQRVDILSGIGQYGVLYLGFNDGGRPETEVKRANNLLYVNPYSEGSVNIDQYVLDEKNPRFGLPEYYKLKNITPAGGASSRGEARVHWSRVIHVAEGLLEDDVLGTPRLKAIWNRLENIDLIAGGSAEMFWRGAYPGISFEADKDAAFGPDTKKDMEDQIKKYLHGLQRFLRLQGVTAKPLPPAVADPTGHLDTQIQLISAATRIPKRILTGSERGELASSQDESSWLTHITTRRDQYVGPRILRPFLQRLIDVGVLPTPKSQSFSIRWPALQDPSAQEQASVGKTKTDTIVAYSNAPAAESILPLSQFLELILGLDQEKVRAIIEEIDKQAADEQDMFPGVDEGGVEEFPEEPVDTSSDVSTE